MARWEGNTVARLERAALTLFREQGYDRTTVAQIAKHAGLTERSFYRWFADKREVLFAGGDELEERIVAAIEAVPDGTSAVATLLTAFAVVPSIIRPRAGLVERAEVIAANPPLQERELIKSAVLAEAFTAALVKRGHDEQHARLATDVASAVLRRATHAFVLADREADFPALLTSAAADLVAVAAQLPRA